MKDIDAQSTAHELASIALETVAPCIKAYFPRFAWWENEFIVRDSKWVNLTRHPSTQPYFYSECIHPSNRKGSKAMTFKTKQFGLFVIVPEMQWEEFDAFREKLEPPQPPPPCPRRMPQRQLASTTLPPDQNKLQPTQPTRARMISQPDTITSSLRCPTIATTGVVSQPVSSSEPPTPLFLSKGLSTSSSVFDRPISQDVLQSGNNVSRRYYSSTSTND